MSVLADQNELASGNLSISRSRNANSREYFCGGAGTTKIQHPAVHELDSSHIKFRGQPFCTLLLVEATDAYGDHRSVVISHGQNDYNAVECFVAWDVMRKSDASDLV